MDRTELTEAQSRQVVFETGTRMHGAGLDLPVPIERAAETALCGNTGGAIAVGSLRSSAKSSPVEFAGKVEEGVNSGALGFQTLKNVLDLFRALSGVMIRARTVVAGHLREIETDAFAFTMSQFVRQAFVEGFSSIRRVSESLLAMPEKGMFVTSSGESFKAPERATWLSLALPASGDPERVDEMQPFPEFTLSEERAHFGNGNRNGRTLKLTRDEMEENPTGGKLYQKAYNLGRWIAVLFERQAFDAISDRYGSAASNATRHVYLPNGIPTPLYSATANEPGSRAPSGTRVTNNAFSDASDFENALARMLTYLAPDGKKAFNHPADLAAVVPVELFHVACQCISEVFGWLPAGERPRVYTSPALSEISSTAWYLIATGQNSQFVRHSELDFEWVSMTDPGAYLRGLVMFEARVAWKSSVNAVDYARAVQSLSGTTAP